MLCLEVMLDGKVICRAGDGDLSLLTATFHVLPAIGMRRLIVSGDLKHDKGLQLLRWLDMSLLDGATISFRVIDAQSAEAPSRVTSFGSFPGDDEKLFCSFCGTAAEETPLMCGPAGNICAPCVKRNAAWAETVTRKE